MSAASDPRQINHLMAAVQSSVPEFVPFTVRNRAARAAASIVAEFFTMAADPCPFPRISLWRKP